MWKAWVLRPHPFLVGLLAFLATMSLTMIAVLMGWNQGLQERQLRAEATAQAYYEEGLARLAAGEFEMARANCQEAWRLNRYPGSAACVAEAERLLTPTPTPTVAPTPTTPPEEIAAALLAEAQEALDAGAWEKALEKLNAVLATAPDYRPDRIQEMRYTALVALARQLLEEDNLEAALFRLDQAAAIAPLDDELEVERQLATRYLEGINYWGVSWEDAIAAFSALYAIAPYYRDVQARLFQAHVAYGDLFAEQEEWCPAEVQYTEAVRLILDAEVEAKRTDAAQRCLTATPTPLPGTEPITSPVTGPQPIEGFYVGRLAYAAYNTEAGGYDLYALPSYDPRPIKAASYASQPTWRPDGRLLAYRNSTGIAAVVPEEGVPLTLVSGPGVAWPTWSPDGQRIAYAVQDATGWQIYVAPGDGSAPPRPVTPGWAPVWGPQGALAYAGCVVEGTVRGICVINPDDPAGQPVPLTADPRDTPVSWSPDGSQIAYMSDHDGDWDVYVVTTGGYVYQVTNDPASDGAPAWAPDGSLIAFVSDRDGSWGIYLVSPDGQNPRKIVDLGTTYPDFSSQRLSWAP